jgi:hypothetical protein
MRSWQASCDPVAQAERWLARLVRALGHDRIAAMLAANDNPVPHEGDAAA